MKPLTYLRTPCSDDKDLGYRVRDGRGVGREGRSRIGDPRTASRIN